MTWLRHVGCGGRQMYALALLVGMGKGVAVWISAGTPGEGQRMG